MIEGGGEADGEHIHAMQSMLKQSLKLSIDLEFVFILLQNLSTFQRRI